MALVTDIITQTTPTEIYASTNDSAITWATFTNYGVSAATLTLYVVPSGDSATNENMILDSESISAGDTFSLYTAGEKLLLSNGDKIYAFSDTATSVNVVISYTSI